MIFVRSKYKSSTTFLKAIRARVGRGEPVTIAIDRSEIVIPGDRDVGELCMDCIGIGIAIARSDQKAAVQKAARSAVVGGQPWGGRIPLSKRQIRRLVRRRDAGESWATICEDFGISRQTALKHYKRARP